MKLNFKDIYKSANNNLSGNKELIGLIFEKAESKKSFFTLYYKQISVCAAAAVLILAIGILPYSKNNQNNSNEQYLKSDIKSENIKEHPSKKSNFDITTHEVVPAETEDIKSTSEIYESSKSNNITENKNNKDAVRSFEDNSFDKSQILTEDSFYSDAPKITESEIVYSPPFDEERTADDKIEENKTSEEVNDNLPIIASEDPTSRSKSTEEFTSKAYSGGTSSGGSAAGGGGGGGARSYRTATLTAEEYFDYLGLGINSFVEAVPQGMTFHIPDNIEVTIDYNDNYLSDYARFVALDNDNSDKILSVYTTKFDGEAKNALKSDYYEIKIINNHKVAISNDASHSEAYFNLNNVWFSVTSANISADDFNNFVFSLLN